MTTTKAVRKLSRIMLVDDHPVVTRGIADALKNEGGMEVVGFASTEGDAIRAADQHKPDLAIVDITLEKGTGLGVIKALSESHPELRILVFTMHDELLYAERAMRAGAHGYLNKCASAGDLITAIRQISTGGIAISEELNERLVHKALGSREGHDGVSALSDRELEIFALIGRGSNPRTIAGKLSISVKTVETHRENIKKKLGISSAGELTRFAVAWVENPS